MSKKYVTCFSCYKFDKHKLTLTTLGRMFLRKLAVIRCLIFPAHLTSTSAHAVGETENPKINISYIWEIVRLT